MSEFQAVCLSVHSSFSSSTVRLPYTKSNGNSSKMYLESQSFFEISYNYIGNNRNSPIKYKFSWSLDIRYCAFQLYHAHSAQNLLNGVRSDVRLTDRHTGTTRIKKKPHPFLAEQKRHKKLIQIFFIQLFFHYRPTPGLYLKPFRRQSLPK